MKFKVPIFILFIITAAGNLTGKELQEKNKNSVSWTRVVLEAVKNHPDIRIQTLQLKEVKGGEVEAGALPNPEADSRVMYNFDAKSVEGEVTLMQKIETAGKRGARLREARSTTKKFLLSLEITREETAASTVLLLNRLQQIKEEKQILAETGQTMKILIARMRRFPRLTPELKITRSLYRMTLRETGSNLALLAAERQGILGTLRRWTGLPEKDLAGITLPAEKLPASIKADFPRESLHLALLREKISIAEFSLEREKARIFPDIGIGPSFSGAGKGSTREIAAGLAVSLPLPILNRNWGGRKIAHARLATSKGKYAIHEMRLRELRRNLVQRYTRLRTIPGLTAGNGHGNDHLQLHHQMNRGIISPSIIIEYHRQGLESIRSRHALQQEALKLLWKIRTLDGTALKEIHHADK